MNKKVAVANSLTNVQQALQNCGFQTTGLDQANQQEIGAIVISGQDKNFLGIQDISTEIPVINAEGLSAADVLEQVRNRMS